MIKRRQSDKGGQCRLVLKPDPEALVALLHMLQAYTDLLVWLDATVPDEQTADLVALHRQYYETARARSRLPAQSVVLALKDWVQRRRGHAVEGMPYDEKLFAVKGIQSVSLATLEGRVIVPFSVADYGDNWQGSAPARLVYRENRFEFLIAAGLAVVETAQKERNMTTENALSRIGRVISGMTHAAISAAEQANPPAVLEQAIREIDGAADEVRRELGKAIAEQHRVEGRRKELNREREDLEEKIRLAVSQGRDELAESGIARQMDIEAQVGVLDRLLADVADRIAQLNQSLDAVKASRREAEARLQEMLAAERAATGKDGHGGAAANGNNAAMKVERAEAVIARVSGVPSGPGNEQAAAIDELNRMARDHAIKERLARLKADKKN